MDDLIKIEAKDFVMSGIEKASGQFGINIEVSLYTLYAEAIIFMKQLLSLMIFRSSYSNYLIASM